MNVAAILNKGPQHVMAWRGSLCFWEEFLGLTCKHFRCNCMPFLVNTLLEFPETNIVYGSSQVH
jgi:hypothetical protein